MKVVTIGRDVSSDIVVNDTKVSRHHIQIVSDEGTYRIVDFGSSNGTFVNGQQITGEMPLMPTDIVRIGNTTLPWQTYFSYNKKSGDMPIRTILWIIGSVTFLVTVLGLFYFLFIHQQQNNPPKQQNVDTEVLKKRKVEIDAIINNDDISYIRFVKFHDSNMIHRIKDEKEYEKMYEDEGECPFEILFVIQQDAKGNIIAAIESPCDETGDSSSSHTHYFTEKGTTFAFEIFKGCFGCGCLNIDIDIMRETLTEFYGDDFRVIGKVHELVDGDGKRLGKECSILADESMKPCTSAQTFLQKNGINLTK
jgi:hypothetical protein